MVSLTLVIIAIIILTAILTLVFFAYREEWKEHSKWEERVKQKKEKEIQKINIEKSTMEKDINEIEQKLQNIEIKTKKNPEIKKIFNIKKKELMEKIKEIKDLLREKTDKTLHEATQIKLKELKKDTKDLLKAA